MLESFTIYLVLGIVIGLGGFMYLFSKHDFPAYIKKKLNLHNNYRSIGFALCVGIILAMSSSLLLSVLNIGSVPAQIIEGVAIGLNCAILAGLVNRKNTSSGTGRGKTKKTADNKSRRSKG